MQQAGPSSSAAAQPIGGGTAQVNMSRVGTVSSWNRHRIRGITYYSTCDIAYEAGQQADMAFVRHPVAAACWVHNDLKACCYTLMLRPV